MVFKPNLSDMLVVLRIKHIRSVTSVIIWNVWNVLDAAAFVTQSANSNLQLNGS